MKIGLIGFGCTLILMGCAGQKNFVAKSNAIMKPVGQMETVARLSVTPGNIAVSEDERIFLTIHPFRPAHVQVIEVLGDDEYESWPNASWQNASNEPYRFHKPLGIQIDRKNRIWVLDMGDGESYQVRLLGFHLDTRELVYDLRLPWSIAPKGSFVQDLAIDDQNGWAYLADSGGSHDPALIIINLKTRQMRRFTDRPSMMSEPLDLVIDAQTIQTQNVDGELEPVRIGLNPITLSGDAKSLFYGSITGETWYRIPTQLFWDEAPDEEIQRFIYAAGPKPVSDGASTDAQGNHFFTAVNQKAIVRMDVLWEMDVVVQDPRLLWPDALSFGPDSWLYVAVNQLHLGAMFQDGEDRFEPPYYVFRVWTGTKGIAGR